MQASVGVGKPGGRAPAPRAQPLSRRRLLRTVAAASLGTWCGCMPGLGASSLPGSNGDRPLCVATTGIVTDLVAQVAGGECRVHALMGPGVDPHLYRPSPGDVAHLSAAAVVFYNGLHLEGKMAQLLRRLGRHRPVVSLGEHLRRRCPERLIPVGEGEYDPHIWFDVELWSRTLPAVERALVKLIPEQAQALRRRASSTSRRLRQLDRWCREQLARIPPRGRVLVTAHDAFRYFGRAYGIQVVGIQGVSTESEAGIADINRLVRMIVGRRIKAIFVESSVPERHVHAILDGCRAAGHPVRLGGQLYSDALGPPGSGADTYEQMVRHNVRTIVQALS